MTEKDPTREELAEAEALRRALEGDGSADGIPDDALSTSALIRYGGEGGTLSDERRRAVLETVLSEVRPRAPERRWLRWLVPALGAAAAATVVALTLPGTRGGASLPAPSVALLRAQASAAGGAGDELGSRMVGYRAAVYEAVADRYGASP